MVGSHIQVLEKQLASAGAQLVILSNSSRRAVYTLAKLDAMGFNPDWFTGAITSGELTHQSLLRRDKDPWFSSLGCRCLHFTWADRGSLSIQGLGLEVTEDPMLADFILCHGAEALGAAGVRNGRENDPDPPGRAVELSEFESLMQAAVKRGLPMIVANPDEVTVEGKKLRLMPGTLGKKYEAMGGEVRWMGKPDPVVYMAANALLGLPASSMLAVGDSLHHDIKGAQTAGIDSVFVGGGIHAAELGMDDEGQSLSLSALNELLKLHGLRQPTYCMSNFSW